MSAGSPGRAATAFNSEIARYRSASSRSAWRRKHFSRLARRAIETEFVRDVLESLSGRAMIIGVDRLDYSKGIPERMNAFERFLTNFPDWRGKVTYLQITPRSRTGIPEYADMGRAVGEAVGRINGTFGEASWTPVRYINKAHSRTALAGLYRAARAGLVTPLRDGMNLVAKEYVAAQDAGRSRRADTFAFCRRRVRMHRGASGQPLSIPKVSETRSIAHCRCRWMNDASVMRLISRCWCATISATGRSDSCACSSSHPAAQMRRHSCVLRPDADASFST